MRNGYVRPVPFPVFVFLVQDRKSLNAHQVGLPEIRFHGSPWQLQHVVHTRFGSMFSIGAIQGYFFNTFSLECSEELLWADA